MLRLLNGLFLTLVLSLTSVTAAVARAEMAGATELVICSGGQMGTVTLDVAGRPVTVAHHCPVCTAAMAGEAGPVWQAVARPMTRSERVTRADVTRAEGQDVGIVRARGPPDAV